MMKKLAQGAFLAVLAAMITVWVVSMAQSGASEPQYDPNVYWLA